MPPPTLTGLRRYAVARSLFSAPDLQHALDTFGFVQADPIRAPARAQDLMLRHRVAGYRAGDLERCYGQLQVEEDFFINYGFVTPALHALMHPRGASAGSAANRARVDAILAFVRERGAVHPREVDTHFAHGRATNYWGGSSSATTLLLDGLHYSGLLRVARRDGGVRVYAARDIDLEARIARRAADIDTRLDALVDVLVGIYAPLPAQSLAPLVRRLRYATPKWAARIGQALSRAPRRLGHASVDGVEWYWPVNESPHDARRDEALRLLAPFDPIVWDRRRFERFWGWPFRFEAYLPVAKRKLGYYALPVLWRDQVPGWANVSVSGGVMQVACGYVAGHAPRDRGFAAALDEEVERLRGFLGVDSSTRQGGAKARRQ